MRESKSWPRPEVGNLAKIDPCINSEIENTMFRVDYTGLYDDKKLLQKIGNITLGEPVLVVEIGKFDGPRPWMKVLTKSGRGYARFLLFKTANEERANDGREEV